MLGPNGAGKTTTLETCEGYRTPAARARSGCSGSTRRDQRRELLPGIGVMLQDGGAWSGVRAVEMLRHSRRCTPTRSPVDELVERLGLGDCGRTPYRRLSGGQQQRLGAGDGGRRPAELVFVDEPTAGHGPAGPARPPGTCSRSCARDGVTVVLTTHYMDEAERLADQVHVIDRGRLIASGTPLELTRARHAARSGWSSPSRSRRPRPASLAGRARRRAPRCTPINEHSLLITGPADATHAGRRCPRWCERARRAAGVADARASAPSRTSSSSSPAGS